MQQGKEASVTLSGTSHCLRRVVIPLLYNGSCRIGLLTLVCSPVQLGGPFGCCAFALLSPCGHSRPRARLSENRFETYSSSSAFLLCCWTVFYDGGRGMSRGRNLFPSTNEICNSNVFDMWTIWNCWWKDHNWSQTLRKFCQTIRKPLFL